MKVLFILSGTTIYGGATKSFINLLTYLMNEKNLDALVVTPDDEGIYKILKKRGLNVINIPYTFATYPSKDGVWNKLLFPLRLGKKIVLNGIGYFKLLKIAKSFKPNIIHSNSSVLDIGIQVATTLKIPHIYHIREYGDLDFHMNMDRINKLLQKKTFTISITNGIGTYKKRTNTKFDRIIYNGIFSQGSLRYNPNKSPYFLYAGRIEKAKGLEDLIKAFLKYSEESYPIIELWIAGSLDQDNYQFVSNTKFELEKRNISDKVKWLGNRKDIHDLMYNATATIVPSFNEAFGRVMPEAMANGCICIGRDSSGLKEQFDNGLKITNTEIGLRFSTVEELVNQMIFVQTCSQDEKEKIITASQNTINKLYTNEMSGKAVYEFYEEILNQND